MGRSTGPTCKQRKEPGIRRATYILGAVLVLALLLASPTTALRPNTTIDACRGVDVTSSDFARWSADVWRPIYWERGAPKRSTIQAQRVKLACAQNAKTRRLIQKRWRGDKRAFYEHRQAKLAQRERLRYTPYDCPSGPAAIPCYITNCESRDSYTAENPSGAYGRYQLMPEWWEHLGRKPTPAEQDRIADDLWAGGAGAGNWVCA